MLQKRMFKVLCPIEKKEGGTYWLRSGNAYTNKDNSINIYVDVLPVAMRDGLKLQLRELTEEDLKPREGRSSWTPRPASPAPLAATQDLPF